MLSRVALGSTLSLLSHTAGPGPAFAPIQGTFESRDLERLVHTVQLSPLAPVSFMRSPGAKNKSSRVRGCFSESKRNQSPPPGPKEALFHS